MNTTLLASSIVSRIRNSMQDSAINQETMVAGMLREAMDEDRASWAISPKQTSHKKEITTLDWPEKYPLNCNE